MRWWQRRWMAVEAAREVAVHIEEKVADLVEAGMSEQEARHQAAREFGNAMLIAETSREVWSWGWLDRLTQDVRYAVRGLRRDPMLALTAGLTLAICIGANTTVFSIVNSILLRPLPYPGSERIYWVSERMEPDQPEVVTGADYYSVKEQNRVFEEVGAFQIFTLNWTGIEKPEQLDEAQVTPSFFRVMGTQPMMGRYFTPDEQGRKAPPVVVLSYAFWRSRMGSDPHLIGKTITLDRLPHTIIGIMPQGFDYPNGTQIYKPLLMDEGTEKPRSMSRMMLLVRVIARLRHGIGQSELSAEMGRVAQNIRTEYPKEFETAGFLKGISITAEPLQKRLTGELRPALLVLCGAVGLVLVIACVNLANLLLARVGARQKELAVRMALGSHWRQMVQQMLTESLMLAMPGGAAGIAVAYLAVTGLNAWKPLLLERYPEIAIDVPTLLFTFGLTLLTGLAFGMAPALATAGFNVHDVLKASGHTHSGGKNAVRLRQLLVVAELGISLLLLIGAGLLSRSFVKLATTDLGFPPENLLTMRVNLAGSRYATDEGRKTFYADVLQRVKELPMVRKAALSSGIPLGESWLSTGSFQVAGRPPVPMAERPDSDVMIVNYDFFRTLAIPLRIGRVFNVGDHSKSEATIVVNEAFARKILPGEKPLGQRLVLDPSGNGPGWRIVGVVSNIRGRALGAEPAPMIYRCACQIAGPVLTRMGLIVRTVGDPHAAIRAVEGQVYAVDRNQPVFDVKTMDERLADSLAPQRFHLALIGTFAVIALVLSTLGVYGVLSYLVTRRTREIGIRIAMGAQPREVRRLVVGESVVLAALAVVAGLAGAWALTRYLQSMLYGVTALDAATFAVMPIVLVTLAITSSVLPAWRASRIDPMAALREE